MINVQMKKVLMCDNRLRQGVKRIFCFVMVIIICKIFFADGLDKFIQEKIYDYQNDFNIEQTQIVDFASPMEQQFLSKGNYLSSIRLYINEVTIDDRVLNISIKDNEGKIVGQKNISVSDLTAGNWNNIAFDVCGLARGKMYTVVIETQGLSEGVTSILDMNLDSVPYLKLSYMNGHELPGRLAIGINQLYHYIDVSHALYLGINLLFLFCLSAVLCLSVMRFEKGVAAVREQGLYKHFRYSIVIAMSFIMMFNPMDTVNTEIKAFSRVMGAGVMSGYDVTKVIGNFTGWMLAMAFVYVLAASFMADIRSASYCEEQENAWHFLDKFMVIAGVNILLRCITFFSDSGTIFYYSSWVIVLIIIAVFAYIFGGIHRKIRFSSFLSVVILTFSVSFPVAIIFSSQWQNGMLLLGVQYAVMILVCLMLRFVKPIISIINSQYVFIWSGTVISSLFPLVLSLYIEIINIIVGQGEFVTRLVDIYIQIVLTMLIVIVGLALMLKKMKLKLPDEKMFAYPLLILGISLLSVQIPLSATYSSDLMEGANAGILISDFLNFGKIPIVQHYGGHMMTSVWEGILYGLINNDYIGAVFSPYSRLITPIIAIAFYYFVKEIWDGDAAFWVVLLFPFLGSISYYGMGLLIVAAVAAYIKKNTYFRAVMLWFACVWVTLYRLDLGFAFDIGCFIALICYIAVYKNWKAIKQLGLTLLGYGVVFGGMWCILCLVKNINPVTRLFEFLKISLSNQNWAYAGIGNPDNTMYAWCYIIVPMLISVSMGYVIISRKFRNKVGVMQWIMLILVGASYFANFSRGLVRHSLVEGSLTTILWTAHLYLAFFIACQLRKELFVPVFALMMLFHTLLATDGVFSQTGIVDNANNTLTSFRDSWTLTRFDYEDLDPADAETAKTYWQQIKDSGTKIERVVVDSVLQKRIKPLEELCDLLLNDDETYVDFMNRTLTYCLLQRENPVYISQSPLQLSGDYTQECFIAEIAKKPDKNPIVIMPYYANNDPFVVSLDGLENTYRYYRVVEYIYQNYRPLCRNDEYAVWCLNDRYEEMNHKLNGLMEKECEIKTYGGGVLWTNALEVTNDENTLTLASSGTDPFISELQNYMDLSTYIRSKVRIQIHYESDIAGTMQMYYTESEGEEYTEQKTIYSEIAATSGIVEFIIPVTEYTRIRLDIPEGSVVKIVSLKYGSCIEAIDYGYDRAQYDTDTGTYLNDNDSLHRYNLNLLPVIWAEMDKANAINNAVSADIAREGQYLRIENSDSIDKTKGNYLAFELSYAGTDAQGYTRADDEHSPVTLRMGTMRDGKFVELYRYTMSALEGEHKYMIRISNDYYWYLAGTDTISVECDTKVKLKNMRLLQGD